jgi:poly-gamma-glutamate synthesis protein (capsule biosynthesis protein)
VRLLLATGIVIAGLLVPPQATTASPEPFRGEILRIDTGLRKRMTGSSWHRGCPVALADLRLLKLSYRSFPGKVRRGYMVVHETAAPRIVRVFRQLFTSGYRIKRMRLVDAYGADDHRSMNADNTSAFNCREVAGRPGVWSRHAYGRAIDLNPVENPYVAGGHVSPAKGRPYARRTPRRRGMISAGGKVVRIFGRVGWEWGGSWSGAKDYQHFSASGD